MHCCYFTMWWFGYRLATILFWRIFFFFFFFSFHLFNMWSNCLYKKIHFCNNNYTLNYCIELCIGKHIAHELAVTCGKVGGVLLSFIPAGTWHLCSIKLTSLQLHDVYTLMLLMKTFRLSYRSEVCYTDPRPKTEGHYSSPRTCNWADTESLDWWQFY